MATQRPTNVRIATPADEDRLVALMHEVFREQPIFKINEEKMRSNIRMATERKGSVIGVIDGPKEIEGYIIAQLAQYWYTDEWHLEELSNFVHPDYRSGGAGHARCLIEFAKWFAEQLNMPLIMGILSTKRLAAKARLYARQATPCGAIFVHNSGHAGNLLSENG